MDKGNKPRMNTDFHNVLCLSAAKGMVIKMVKLLFRLLGPGILETADRNGKARLKHYYGRGSCREQLGVKRCTTISIAV